MCRTCIADLVEEETLQQCKDLFSSVRELMDTLSSVRSSLVKNPAAQTDSQQSTLSSPLPSTSKAVEVSDSEDASTLIPLMDSDKEGEEADLRTSRYKPSLEEVDDLLKAIYMTLGIQEEKIQLSVHDKMYRGLDESKHRVFPVH